ncbi:phage major tail tube protein [Serratia sp. BIGb0163]|uniref:phage major tail tube protein n=1 Tax=Serratia sp. BIGb0163 TaxID=2940613 RepID=UPI002167DE88|nr:phage major tail tube protein [Serratia sp. BIGb0163]MCS4265165.1 P2 family phage contractile tail tube protein [Serratia sp. BIGb0163]
MSDKATVRAWTFFAGGFRIQGAHEYTPPELSIVKTDLRTGAQDAPTPMDDGMEALICQIKFYGIDTDMLTRFGFVTGNRNRFAAYEGYLSNGRALGVIDEIEGFVSKITPDARDNQALSEKATTVEIAINYYKQTFEGRELFEIDTERFIRRVNGVDQLRGIAAKIRL